MKKQLLTLAFGFAVLSSIAQTPRLSLYEEFTGETCPPCAATNPGLNALLAQPTNTPKVVAIKWQVPIPSAPTNTWSLYKTNQAEIDWRYKSAAAGGYGYAINSAPSARMDGQNVTVFGASSDHPANLNNNVISTAQSYTSAFSIAVNRAWDATYSAVNLTVNIQATADFTATGSLIFRTVMVEREIHFAVQSGTNGEKDFEDVAIKSFPTLQSGVSMVPTWTVGQTQTFTLNCPIPSYTRDKAEIAFVGFIQDDGNKKVAQAVRVDRDPMPNDVSAIKANIAEYFVCGSNIDSPEIEVKNNGSTDITAFNITPYINGTASNDITTWIGNLAVGASTTIPLSSINTTVSGGVQCIFKIGNVSGTDVNLSNNNATAGFYLAQSYQKMKVAEGFTSTVFPPTKWGIVNANGGASWSRATVGKAPTTGNSVKYDFFSNSVTGDADELILPPLDLDGVDIPNLMFDVAYAKYSGTPSNDDMLEVFVSEDCGQSWTNIYGKAGDDLATAAAASTAFSPTSSQWRREEAPLDQFSSFSSILVKFVATSAFGNNLYIDNINLQQTNPTGIRTVKNNVSSVELYPNPSQNETTLKINALNFSNAKVSIVNILGQTVYSKDTTLDIGENNISLNVSQFPQGIYNVVINTERDLP